MGKPNQQASKQYKNQSIKMPFNDSLGGSIKFFDKVHEDSWTNERTVGATNSSITIKPIDKAKELKKIKDEAILSLNYKPLDSEPLANVVFKANKASDRELMAKLNDSPLCKDDIIKYRQETYDKGVSYKETNKEMKNLFNTKDFLINNVASITNSISSHKLLELRNSPQLKSSMSAALKADKKLSAMQSHREIVKEIKKTKDTPDTAKENISADASKQAQATASSNIHAAQFLKQHITDLKILQSGKSQMQAPVKQKPQAANDLELVGKNTFWYWLLIETSVEMITPKHFVSKKNKRFLRALWHILGPTNNMVVLTKSWSWKKKGGGLQILMYILLRSFIIKGLLKIWESGVVKIGWYAKCLDQLDNMSTVLFFKSNLYVGSR
jgi:hypothetical protein